MKKNYFLFIAFLFFAAWANAQQYKWVRGGGSTDNINNGGIQHEMVRQMCTDDNKNVYILAQVGKTNIKADAFQQTADFSSVAWHILFASYDCNGNLRYAKLLQSNGNNFVHGLVYGDGKIYVSGTLYNINKKIGNDASFNTQYQSAFLAKFDTSGQYDWAKFVGPDVLSSTGAGSLYGRLALDGSGNVHHFISMNRDVQISPSVTSTAGTYDLKYNPAGTLLSATKLQMADTFYGVTKVIIDKTTNDIYALFNRTQTVSRTQNFLVKFTSGGVPVWADTISFGSALSGFRLGTDGIYVSGEANGMQTFGFGGLTASNTTHATGGYSTITKLDFIGKAKWIRHVDGSTANHTFWDVELLPEGQIAAFGFYNGKSKYGSDSIMSATGGTIFPLLFIVDTSGTLVKMQEITSTSNSIGLVCSRDKYGSLYLAGQVGGTITPSGLSTYTSNGGNSDFFLTKYGYDCNCTAFPTSIYTHTVNAIAKSAAFTFSGTTPADSVVWDFGDNSAKMKQNNPTYTYTNTGTYKVCATVYTSCGFNKYCSNVVIPTVSVNDVDAAASLNYYPNPFSDVLTIEGLKEGSSVQLFNMVGQQVYNGVATGSKEALNTYMLQSGNYVLRITDPAGNRITKTVVKR